MTGWLDPMFPSFAELEAQNRGAARAKSDAELQTLVETLLDHQGAGMDDAIKAEIRAVLEGAAAPSEPRWSEELWNSLRRQGYLVRPGTVEDLWFYDGALRELARRRARPGHG